VKLSICEENRFARNRSGDFFGMFVVDNVGGATDEGYIGCVRTMVG
jgi:hypothetical protein